MHYEKLMAEYDNRLTFDELEMKLKGLYIDGNVAIKKTLGNYEKCCVLAEEIGHYETSYGQITNQMKVSNRKQERKARAWSYEKLLPLDTLITAFHVGCANQNEIAEFAEVTEEFLESTLIQYKEKYGLMKIHGNYIIYFEPLTIIIILK